MNVYRSQIPILEGELKALTEQCAELEAQAERKATNLEAEQLAGKKLKGNEVLIFALVGIAMMIGAVVMTQQNVESARAASKACDRVLGNQAPSSVLGSDPFRETCRKLCRSEASPQPEELPQPEASPQPEEPEDPSVVRTALCDPESCCEVP